MNLLLLDASGSLGFTVLLAFLLALLLTPLVAVRFRRAIRKHMSYNPVGQQRPESPTDPIFTNTGSLTFLRLDKQRDSTSYNDLYANNRKLVGPFLLGVLTYGLLAGAVALAAKGLLSPMRLPWYTLALSFPGLLFVAIKYGLKRVRLAFFTLAYVLIFLVLTYALAIDRSTAFSGGIILLGVLNVIPLTLYFILSLGANGNIRQYLFLFLLSIGAALSTFVWLFDGRLDQVAGAVGLATAPYLIIGGLILFWMFYFVGTWWLMEGLSKRYQRKQLSDWMLQLDFLILIVAIGQLLQLLHADRPWIVLAGLPIAFVAYLLITRLALRAAFNAKAQQREAGLLLLRVFGHGQRSRRFFKDFAFHWQFYAPVHLISAPDLAGQLLEPHEVLDFFSGRLRNQYVNTPEQLRHRLDTLDELPDPDGRYRINEFYCGDAIWKDTVIQLLGRSRAVLMDLRSFSAQNKGCIFELTQLLLHVQLDNILFLTDPSTDLRFLEQTLQKIWGQLPRQSVNFGQAAVQLFHLDHGGVAQLEQLKQAVGAMG